MSKNFENNHKNQEPNQFGLPEGYFERSANSIFNKVEWIEEHKEFPQLSQLKKVSGFVVPGDYFERSEAELELLSYPVLLKYKNKSGFIVPQNYFEELEVNELAKVVSKNSLNNILPLDDTDRFVLDELINNFDKEHDLAGFYKLNSIPKHNPFIVSENYFQNSAEKIIASTKKPARIINLFGSPKLWYSSAAAVLTITIGLWIYNQYFTTAETKDCGTLACVDKSDLVKAKNLEGLDNDQLYEIVDAKKLEEKLEGKDDKKNGTENSDSISNAISPDDLPDEI